MDNADQEVLSKLYIGLKENDYSGRFKKLYNAMQNSGIEVCHMNPASLLDGPIDKDILSDFEKMYLSLI